MKNKFFIILILALIFVLCSTAFADEKSTLDQVKKLTGEKEYSKAIEILNKEMTRHKPSVKLLGAKTRILLKLKRYKEALETSIKSYKINPRKSPWRSMEIVSIYLKLKDNEGAFKWLETAVKQGFLSYSALNEKEFELLRKDKRFNPIIERIKSAIGIGKPAKDFSSVLLSGEKFSLSGMKGKVVLIDFWATWCPPCVKGIPHLKKLYEKYKESNFEVIGISLDNKKELVEKYIAKNHLKWKMIYSGKAWSDDIAKLYRVNLIPSYWVIDKEGVLRDFGMHLRDEHKLAKAIEKLL